MYVLDFLKDTERQQHIDDVVTHEYRLLCSGEIYNGNIQTFDWRKSDATRIILTSPFELFVCSRPFSDYPQELALRFSTRCVTESWGSASMSFHPDKEIAHDIAALLSLLLRRLITVSTKVRELHPKRHEGVASFYEDFPWPFINSLASTSWQRQLSTVIYGENGIKDIIDYNPSPKAIDAGNLNKLLRAIPALPQAESVVLSARSYALSLECIRYDTNFAYQMLIRSIETMANDVFRSYKPSEPEMIQAKKSVEELAKKFGLSQEQANEITVEACKGMSWLFKKFVKFLNDYKSDDFWSEDELFKVSSYALPKKENFESDLERIYRARSNTSHSGGSFPECAGIGTGPTVPAEVMMQSLGRPEDIFPPVAWFERVVNLSIRKFMEQSTNISVI